ncbi:MAG: protein kinase [Actinobacteria bacterium]|nr:protein kinase [Actinomycetota bacterium]
MSTGQSLVFTGPEEDPQRYRVDPEDFDAAIEGGEGLVFRAHRRDSPEAMALKLWTRLSPTQFDDVRARSGPLSEVRHPHLMTHVETFAGRALTPPGGDVDDEFDVYYSTAMWVDGVPLTEVGIEASSRRKMRWIRELALALQELHQHRSDLAPDGLVHRDVKPSNVLIRPGGAAVLVDFGTVRPVADRDLTEGLGTVRWRSPEVLSYGLAPQGPATDRWGLGAIAHWLFAGTPPALDGASASYRRLLASPALQTFREHDALADHFAQLLHSAPSDRPADLTSWVDRLDDLIDERGPVARNLRAVGALVGVLLAGSMAYSLSDLVVADPFADRLAPNSLPRTSPNVDMASRSTIAGPPTTPPPTVSCRGNGLGLLTLRPPLDNTVRDITFSLAEPSTSLTCDDGTGEAVTVLLQTASFRVEAIDCARLGNAGTNPVTGTGSAEAIWSNGDSATLDMLVTLPSLNGGVLTLKVISGRFDGYSGSATVSLSRPHGSCETGVTEDEVSLTELTLIRPD